MKIESARFGTLEVNEEQVIQFPHGIPGFLNEKAFVHLPHEEDSPFSFLQSISDPNLSFLLVAPFAFIEDYEFELEDEIAKELDLSEENLPRIHLIATVKGKVTDMTVNLMAPLVINEVNRIARQVILDKTEYSVRHRLFSDISGAQSTKGGV